MKSNNTATSSNNKRPCDGNERDSKHRRQELTQRHQPQYHIIGDVYVDIVCNIPSRTQNSSDSSGDSRSSSVLCLDGTDTSIFQPIASMAGGSTINTATYLQYLQRREHLQHNIELSSHKRQQQQQSVSPSLDITVHTIFNPNDYYGSILLHHSRMHHITLQNGYSTIGRNDPARATAAQESTPHCLVMISSTSPSSTSSPSIMPSNNEAPTTTTTTTTASSSLPSSISSERTFLTHRGCATDHMYISNLFPSITTPSTASSSSLVVVDVDDNHPIHYHIAGYYCTPEFWRHNSNDLKDDTKDSLLSFVQNIFTNHASKQNGPNHSTTTNSTTAVVTTRPPIVLSLVTQYDTTQQWDVRNLKSILPYMHICIMNELEAEHIYNNNRYHKNEESEYTSDDIDKEYILFSLVIPFFTQMNTSTIYVITRGAKGAIAFRNNKIVAQVHGTVNITSVAHSMNAMDSGFCATDIVIDPTGAGDAFCAGFFHSLWQSIDSNSATTTDMSTSNLYQPTERYWSNNAVIQNALLFGCTVGTCSVLQRGGSTPPLDANLIQLVHDQYKQDV